MRRNCNGLLFYKHTDKEVLVYFPTRRSALRGVSPKSAIVAERRYIALVAQILQPRRYVHAVILGSEKRQTLVDDDIPLPSGLPAPALK
jgi:hypothetical protein